MTSFVCLFFLSLSLFGHISSVIREKKRIHRLTLLTNRHINLNRNILCCWCGKTFRIRGHSNFHRDSMHRLWLAVSLKKMCNLQSKYVECTASQKRDIKLVNISKSFIKKWEFVQPNFVTNARVYILFIMFFFHVLPVAKNGSDE